MKIVEVPLGDGQVAKLTKPEREDFPPNLGGAIQYTFASIIIWIAETSGDALGSFLGSGLVSFLERIEPKLVEYYSPIIEEIKGIEGIPEWFAKFLDRIQHPEDEVGAAIAQSVLGTAAGGVTGSLLGALLAPLTYGVNARIRPARPALPDLIAADWRDVLDDETIDDWLKDQGWPDAAIEAYRELLRPRPSVADLIDWAWRVHQDPETIREELQKRGFSDEDIDKYMELAQFIPSVGDLISMAVREAWRDDVAERYGYDEDFPTEFQEWAKKRGLSEEWAKRYWRAHWALPGPVMSREMLWRTDMTEEDYKTLLRIADYPRAFRDWMTEIAYRPYTRVDVRRMHKLGVLSDEELVRAYLDLGFDREKAENMARFTILYNMESELEYTKAEILKGYRLGMMSRGEAKDHLIQLGNSEQYAEYLLDLEDYKRATEEIDEQLRYIRILYINGEIDRTEATSRLGKLDLEADRISRYLDMWTFAREAKIARPTRAMIEEFYKDDIITEEEARIELAKRHYPDYVIDWMIADWDQQIAEAARKEAERAQKEQERIAKAEFRTKRMVALANLNTQIAEARLHIAELKIARFYAETAEEKERITGLILELKKIIRELQLQKAQVPVVPEEGR